MTSPASPKSDPPAPDGPGRRWPRPSRRQTWFTAGLVAVAIGFGVFAIVNKSGASPGATSGTSPGTSAAAGAGATPGTSADAGAGGTSTAAASSGPTSTVPGSNGKAAQAAANLEIALRSKIGGCWDDAEAGTDDGAYRQDFHYGEGRPCGGAGWDIDVQFFASPQAASRAGRRVGGGQKAYTDGPNLIVVAGDAPASTRQAVASHPGVRPA